MVVSMPVKICSNTINVIFEVDASYPKSVLKSLAFALLDRRCLSKDYPFEAKISDHKIRLHFS